MASCSTWSALRRDHGYFLGLAVTAYSGTSLTLGASGSIFGLLAAAIVYGRRQGNTRFTRQFLKWRAPR